MAYKLFWVLCSLLLIDLSPTCAQQENVWAFGIRAGLDFNTTVPAATNTNITSNEGCASVCNANGQLLFYTNGEKVWDQTHNFMQNGISINLFNISSTTQGVLIVPMPDSNSKYYIFSLTALENMQNSGRLYYSIVDMNLNNGLGAVVPGRNQILVDSGFTESMTAVAGKNCNIWLLGLSKQHVLKAFNIDHNGIDYVPVLSPVLPPGGTILGGAPGSISVSRSRDKLAIADGGLTLCDFDATTGVASNPLNLTTGNNPLTMYYSVCFSPNSSKLYAAKLGAFPLEQFDLSSGIPSVIANSATFVTPGRATTTLKLGPDNKLYFSQIGSFLSVLHQPDQLGAACMFQADAILLANNTSAQLGLPNVVPIIIPNGDSLFSTETIDVTECFTETHQLQADTLGVGLVWEDGSTMPLRTINAPGTYWVTYSKRCVVYSDTFVVHFPNATPEVLIFGGCKGSNNGMAIAYSPNTSNNYTWRNAVSVVVSTSDTLMNASGGHYTLHVVTSMGCEATIPVFIPVEEHTASFLVDSIICQSTTVSFNNTSSNHFTQFEWTFGDGDNSVLQTPIHAYANMGYYTATLIATGTICIDTAYQTITVDSLLNAHYNTEPDSICTGQSINFHPNNDSTIQNLQWSYGDGITMTMPGEDMVQHAYDSAGTMPVQLITEYRACPSSTFVDTVYVYPLPKVYLGSDTGLCLDGAPVLLQNQLPAPAAVFGNLWSTGDTTATIKVVHPGIYSLTISSGPLGCSATESLVIHKDCYVDIPNAFTPNGDGENDYFFPRQLLSRKVTRFNMKVLNRWGQLVFETTRTDGRGWDGQFNGNPQPQGVYVYFIDLTIDSQRAEKHNGNITLIR